MPNFFSLYDDYTKPTEPPAEFHAWSAIAAISALLGKKCFIPHGHFNVFPQLYIVLVGPPGTRKTTAMNVAKKLLSQIETVPMAPDSATRESLIDNMARSPVNAELNGTDVSYWQNSAFVSELQEFLGGRHINQAMVGFLTAIWDEDVFKERTRKGGEVIIHNPYFTLLGCCTTSWMNEKLKQDIISDGFTRRTCFILATKNSKEITWPTFTPGQVKAKGLLVQEALRIHALKGQFRITKPAFEAYDKIYKGIKHQAAQFSEKLQSYFSSKSILLLKLCMCIAAGARDQLIIDTKVLTLAEAFLETAEQHMEEIFAGVGRNELKSQAEKIYARIAKTGSLTRKQLTLQSYDDVSLPELQEIIEYLNSSGRVTIEAAADPVLKVAKQQKPLLEVDLLGLTGQLGPSSEPLMEDFRVFELANQIAPETERHLTRKKERRALVENGVLLKGKPRQDSA